MRRSNRSRRFSGRKTRVRYAAPRPLLQRLSPTLCTPISKFTATFVTDAGPPNPWWRFADRRFSRRCSPIRGLGAAETSPRPQTLGCSLEGPLLLPHAAAPLLLAEVPRRQSKNPGCLLYPRKRTLARLTAMSALCSGHSAVHSITGWSESLMVDSSPSIAPI
jgi:hypothetical protein